MKPLKAWQLLLMSIILMVLFFVPSITKMGLLFIAAGFFYRFSYAMTGERINKASEMALPLAHEIYQWDLGLGSKSRAVQRHWSINALHQATVEQLCLSDTGLWFILQCTVDRNRNSPSDIFITGHPSLEQVLQRLGIKR